MSDEYAVDDARTRAPAAEEGRLVVAVRQGPFVVAMVAAMVGAFALNVFLWHVFGLRTPELGFPGYFLALGGLLAFVFGWNAVVTALQGWMIRRYSGVDPARGSRKLLLPPYWRRDRGLENEELQPSLFNNAPGASLGRGDLVRLVCVAPVTAAVSLIFGLVLVYILRIDYLVMIGLTAGLGGQLAFFMLIPRLLRLSPSARFEMSSEPSAVYVSRER